MPTLHYTAAITSHSPPAMHKNIDRLRLHMLSVQTQIATQMALIIYGAGKKYNGKAFK